MYLRIKTGLHSYAPGSNARAWILQIAKNCALSELRRRKDEVSIDGLEIAAADAFGDGSVTDVMRRVLTEEEQQIVTLHVLWQYKHREIAELLGITTDACKKKYQRAADKLRESL